MANAKESKTCAVCGKSFHLCDLVPGLAVRDVIANEILREHPEWSPDKLICRPDLNHYRSDHHDEPEPSGDKRPGPLAA
jgi:hypothetical protein